MEEYKLIDNENSLVDHSEVESINRDDFIVNEKPDEYALNQHKQETECTNSSEENSTSFESANTPKITSMTSESIINKEIMNNQLVVLEPSNPIMTRFQNTLKQYLLKQRNDINQELITLEGEIRSKQNEKFSLINEINNIACRVEKQHNLLNEFQKMQMELKMAKEQVDVCINFGKQRYKEILMKTTVQTKQISVLQRQLNCSQGLLRELRKYEKEQEITFNMCNQKKSQAKQYKKKLLNEQQKQDLLLFSLTQEILRLEDRIKQLGEQAETKCSERELLKQKVMDISTDLDAINEDNSKITLLWNDVLINIQQRDKSFRKIKNDFQEVKNKYHTLLMEANSYKRSAQEQFHKNNDLQKLLYKLKENQNNLQNSLKTCLEKFNYLKDEYSKLIQITEFQNQNLDQVIFDQKSIKNETNNLLHSLDIKIIQKLKFEEENLDELKKQLFANKYCIQINNKITELKVQNKEHELILVGIENKLSQTLLKLEQYRTTSYNLGKNIEENTKYLNGQGFNLSTLKSELKKLYTEIQNKSNQIDLENKQLENVKKKQNEGYIVTPQMKINDVKHKIDEVLQEIEFIKQSWVQKQNKNVQLLDQRNKQLNKLIKVRKYVLVMETKNTKQEQEICSISKEVSQYKRTHTNMRNTISKLNENFSQNKGKSNQLLNENEWLQCSYLIELKDNEKQCLEYIDRLKLLKNELYEMKNVYIEKQRESNSWDNKVKLLIEMKKEMKKKDGDLGDIDTMKKEIHRMQIREGQLKKILEKIMTDLEVCVSRREMIYNKVAAKDIRLKGKNESKQKFLKKLDDLRINIKKIKIECKNLDRNINDLQHEKMELESKFSILNDRLIELQININNLIRNIEDIGGTKLKNMYNLIYKQDYGKFLDDVKKGKYRLLIKSESKMNEEFAAEWKKNSDLISVVEALKNDFPHLDFQITRLFNILKSINNY